MLGEISSREFVRDMARLAEHEIVLTTYGALDKCVTALPSVAWRRVVLDEMQEVRLRTPHAQARH